MTGWVEEEIDAVVDFYSIIPSSLNSFVVVSFPTASKGDRCESSQSRIRYRVSASCAI